MVPKFRIVETPYVNRGALGLVQRLLGLNPDDDARARIKRHLGVASKKSLIDFFITRGGEMLNYPDSEKGWRPVAIKEGHKLLGNEDVDAIISSSSPVTSHVIAKELMTSHKIPWIADLRDLWTQNHNYSYSQLRKMIDRRLELKTLSAADALVTVSRPWADSLAALHKGKPTYCITNGFDPETVNLPPARLTSKFTMTYTGNIYAVEHAPIKLFEALRDLISENVMNQGDIEVRFYGNVADWLKQEIKEYGLSGIVSLFGPVPREIALQKQRESTVLFLAKWQNPRELGAYSGKIFEYLAAMRPVLAIGGSHDVVTELLSETGAGVDVPTAGDVKNALLKLHEAYKQNKVVDYGGVALKIDEYSHRQMARRFSELLDGLAENMTVIREPT